MEQARDDRTECRKLALLRAMISMAAADDNVDDSEVASICKVYREVTKGELSPGCVSKFAATHPHGDGETRDYLRSIRHQLDRTSKEDIIRAAYLVLLADGHIAAGERKKLIDLATALDMPEIHYKAVLEDIEH